MSNISYRHYSIYCIPAHPFSDFIFRHLACEENHIRSIKLLVDHGSKLKIRNKVKYYSCRINFFPAH